jgi:hypothetical protein
MKNFGVFLAGVITFIVISCQTEEPVPGKETGRLHIDIGLSIQVNEVSNVLKSTQQTEGFKVIIYNTDGTEVRAFDNLEAMPDTIELEMGEYYVVAHSDNDLPAAFENPFYHGSSDVFSIEAGSFSSVQVTCQLANTIVGVVYSENVETNFSDYTTTVSTSLGSLIFSREETRLGYFHPAPMEILVELVFLQPDGSTGNKILAGDIPDPMANKHYEIQVDASLDNGQATFQILLDESPVEVVAVEITQGPPPIPGAIAYGELLITEIMYDPTALADTEGEWFEIYNNSGRTLQLQNLVLARDEVNQHTITESIELPPTSYYVFARTEQATGVANEYLYGSDISLSNTGAVLALYNEGPGSLPGSLIFALDYGEASFPAGTGASIVLDPSMLNVSEATSGSSWCTSTSVFSTGDLGSPGLVNDPCQ